MKHVLSALHSLSVAIFLCAVTLIWFVTAMWYDRPIDAPATFRPLRHDPAIESVVHRKDCLEEWELGDNLIAYNNNPKVIAARNLCWNSEFGVLAPCNTWTDPSKP